MSDSNTQRKIRDMVDNLSDTMSWADLAKELDKYVSTSDNPEGSPSDAGETIEMADLLKTLGEDK